MKAILLAGFLALAATPTFSLSLPFISSAAETLEICVTPGYPFSRHKIIEVPPPSSANSSPTGRRSTQNSLPSASK